MQTLLIRERYKVVRVITVQKDYALLEAVDISDRETPSCLVNLYEGELLHRYARIYAGIRREDFPAFRGMFLECGTLVTVFDRSEGECIDRLFYRGDKWNWEDRLYYTELLLHCALSLSNLPPELCCAALLSDNVLFRVKDRSLALRWMMVPMDDMDPREPALLASDQVRKILPRGLSAVDAEQQLLDRLEEGSFRNTVALYACWREAEENIRAEHEEYDSKGFLKKGLILLGRALRRLVKRGGRT